MPTHVLPEAPLPVWAAPAAGAAPVATADPRLEARVVERTGEWAKVEFANGWSGWVDGRTLVPLRRTIPPGGLAAWTMPDASAAPTARAEGGLRVRMVESSNGWAHVEFDNGWTAWVDGRALAPENARAAPAVPSRRAISPLPALGAILVAAGGFLPWATAGGSSSSAWDVALWALVTHRDSTGSVEAGPFLLLPLLACIPYLTRRPFPAAANLVLAVIGPALALSAVVLITDVDDPGRPELGLGLGVTVLGGLVLAAEVFWRRRGARPRPRG
ncbi:MAG: SH3 domain-containing protein [Acidimicrobiia bacterium]